MKRYLREFEFTEEFVIECIFDCLDGKWKRKDVSYFLAEYYMQLYPEDRNRHHVSLKIRHRIKEDRHSMDWIIPYIAKDIYSNLINKTIKLKPILYQRRYDAGCGKERDIGISSIKQQVYDYIAVNCCKKMFLSKIMYYQCASLKGKGQLFGKKAIEKWLRHDRSNSRYAYKCDIKKYYDSVSHSKLKELLKRDIKNKSVLYLLYFLIDTYKMGLCIGSYLCQYLANYYISYAYHFASEKLYCMRRNKRINYVSHILFYLDDILMLSSNLRYLKKASELFEKYLRNVLYLTVKPTKRLFRIGNDTVIDMMGYKISRSYTSIRKKTFNSIRKSLIKAKRNMKNMSLSLAHTLVSYHGWIKYSNNTKLLKKYKVVKIVSIAKGVISYESKIHRQAA